MSTVKKSHPDSDRESVEEGTAIKPDIEAGILKANCHSVRVADRAVAYAEASEPVFVPQDILFPPGHPIHFAFCCSDC